MTNVFFSFLSGQVCQNREVLAQFVVSANVQPTTIDEQCLQGLPKDLLNDVIKLKFGSGLEGLSELIGVAATVQQQQQQPPTSRLKQQQQQPASAAVSAAIMSSEQRPMAEPPADSMCFFDQNIMDGTGSTGQVVSANDDDDDAAAAIERIAQQVAKEPTDERDKQQQLEDERSLEQIMSFASDINVQPGDISQNVEDILQVSSASLSLSLQLSDYDRFRVKLNLLGSDDQTGRA